MERGLHAAGIYKEHRAAAANNFCRGRRVSREEVDDVRHRSFVCSVFKKQVLGSFYKTEKKQCFSKYCSIKITVFRATKQLIVNKIVVV